jgi:hypothetical protein
LADELKKSATAQPPVRYRIERRQLPEGVWVEYGGELIPGSQARLAIEAVQPGLVTVRSGNEALSVAVQPGQIVHFPAAGSLPSGAGEREVAILFSTESTRAFAAPVQSYRAKAAPGAGQRQQQQQELAAASPAADYTVTVRLRYR